MKAPRAARPQPRGRQHHCTPSSHREQMSHKATSPHSSSMETPAKEIGSKETSPNGRKKTLHPSQKPRNNSLRSDRRFDRARRRIVSAEVQRAPERDSLCRCGACDSVGDKKEESGEHDQGRNKVVSKKDSGSLAVSEQQSVQVAHHELKKDADSRRKVIVIPIPFG